MSDEGGNEVDGYGTGWRRGGTLLWLLSALAGNWACSGLEGSAGASQSPEAASIPIGAVSVPLVATLPRCARHNAGAVYFVEDTKEIFYCNGMNYRPLDLHGIDGFSSIIETSAADATQCPTGGSVITAGADLDRDGALDPAEVSTSVPVCNGIDGQDGVDGQNGADGEDGTSCSVADNGDGTKTISCTDGTSVLVSDGTDGSDGQQGAPGPEGPAGQDGEPCTTSTGANGVIYVTCPGTAPVAVNDVDGDGVPDGVDPCPLGNADVPDGGACGSTSSCSGAACTPNGILQFGTVENDRALAAVEGAGGDIFVAGTTEGALDASFGGTDAFVRKYSAEGVELWTIQFGTMAADAAASVAASPGAVFVGGTTDGTVGPEGNAGQTDVFLRRLSSVDGSPSWSRQLGSAGTEAGGAVAADGAGDVYVCGTTDGDLASANEGSKDIFVVKLSGADGTTLWTRQIGSTSADGCAGLEVDAAGHVVVAGDTAGEMAAANPEGDRDLFAARLSGVDGTTLWATQYGGSSWQARSVAIDDAAGAVYVAAADVSSPSDVGNALRLDLSNGQPAWDVVIANVDPSSLEPLSINVLPDGRVLVAGRTRGTLTSTAASLGDYDAFAVTLSPLDGGRTWVGQFGTPYADAIFAARASGSDRILVAGATQGDLGGTNAGQQDAFVAKLESPAP